MKSVKVIGDEQAAGALRDMGARALDQRRSMETAGRAAQRSITGIPVDTGRLARSVHGGAEGELNVTPFGFLIASNVPYAPFVFGGTSKMPARPPRVPAGIAESTAALVSEDLAP